MQLGPFAVRGATFPARRLCHLAVEQPGSFSIRDNTASFSSAKALLPVLLVALSEEPFSNPDNTPTCPSRAKLGLCCSGGRWKAMTQCGNRVPQLVMGFVGSSCYGFYKRVNRQHGLGQSLEKGSPSRKKSAARRGLPPTQSATCL